MRSVLTNLSFKINEIRIVIFKDLSVNKCKNCSEYLLEDPVMKRGEEILQKVNTLAELEAIDFAVRSFNTFLVIYGS